MAKRFTATEKWIDPWFGGLSLQDKVFWIYLLDNCDHAGIWQVNWPLVQFHIKDYVFNDKVFNGRIKQLTSEKWFIPKFITFQYGELNSDNRAHLSVISILKKEGAFKGLITPLQGRKDKDKDMDKDKDKEYIGALKSNPAYAHIDIDTELGKMDAWLLAHKGRQKTKQFVLRWLNKIEKPLPINKPVDNTDALIKADREKMERMKRDATPMPEDCRAALAKVGVKIPCKV